MRISATERAEIRRLSEDFMTLEYIMKESDLRTAILHVKMLLWLGEDHKARNWHRLYSARMKRDTGIEMPPCGRDIRHYTARFGPLKTGKHATPETLAAMAARTAGAVAQGEAARPRRAVAGGPLGISVHISRKRKAKGRGATC